LLCKHCQIKISNQPVLRKNEGEDSFFCCNGCAEVYAIIIDGGMEDYYRTRVSESETFDPLFYDFDESSVSEYIKDDRYQSIKLQVDGIHCQSCIWLLGKILEKTDGVQRFSFAAMSGSVQVEWDNEVITLPKLIRIFYQMGYPALPYTLSGYHASLKKQCSNLLVRFGTAAFLSMNIMIISLALYLGYFEELGKESTLIFSWMGCLLATPVLFGCGAPIFKQAWSNVKKRIISMDVLIVSGAVCAYVASVYGTLTNGKVYYDTSAMIITLVLLGRLIEANAKNKGGDTIARYLTYQAQKAIRVRDGKKEAIHPKQIRAGDLIEVTAGEAIPSDGVIVSGKVEISRAVITGEPMPVLVTAGSNVTGGTVVENGSMVFKATDVGEKSFLGKLIKITEQAQNSRTNIQRIADKITNIFVPIVGFLTIAAFIFRMINGDGLIQAAFVSISVILIACPCALGLATPLAFSLAVGSAARRGIIIKESNILEQINSIENVFFDKTGTLTQGKPCVTNVVMNKRSALPYLINLEKYSKHPIAQAIVSYADDIADMDVINFDNLPGHGVMAVVGGARVAAGTPEFLLEQGFADTGDILSHYEKSNETIIFVGFEKEVTGFVTLQDIVRPESKGVVQWLKSHKINVHMLTGDGERAAACIAKNSGVERVYSRCLPEEKLEHIKLTKKDGAVMMVGDGANDAPALALSDIGVAMGSGVGMAIENSQVTLLRNSIDDIQWLFEMSKKTMLITKQNLFWAFIYNAIGIPLAISGTLTPIHSALAMVASSLCVVGNSIRIKESYNA